MDRDRLQELLQAREQADQELEKLRTPMTILFSDIKGSTAYAEKNGDVEYMAMISRHNTILFPVIEGEGGRIVKTIGDAILACFQEPVAAVKAAAGMQRVLLEDRKGRDETNQIHIRIGMHKGLGLIKDGDVFNREKIAKGLEYLSKAYGELGYINFTSIPNTSFDEDKRLVFLDIDVDEGKQFYVDSINILGLEESDREELLKSFPIKSGQLYNQALYESFLLKNPSMFSDCGCGSERKLDERTGTITLTFDFRPCPVE